MVQVVCLGILVADVVGKTIEAFPPKGTLAAVDRMELHAGGCAANTGIALAKLGVATAVQGKVGRDGFGDFLAQTLEKHGVDASCLVRDDHAATSATMVAVDGQGERTFLHHTGANAAYAASDVRWPQIEQAPILHIAGPFLMPQFIGVDNAAVLKRAKEMGKTTTLDTVWDFTGRWMSVLEPCLPFLDYALPSLEEARHITGRQDPRDIAQVFLDKGVGVVGIKMGEEGSYVRTAAGDELTAPPLRVEAVDALGRGGRLVGGLPVRADAGLGFGAHRPLRQRRGRVLRPGSRGRDGHPLLRGHTGLRLREHPGVSDANTRDHLANERTFLAWVRTSISLMGFGVVIAKLRFLIVGMGAAPAVSAHTGARSTLLGLAFAGVGVLTLAFALFHYEQTRRAIDSGDYRAPGRGLLVFAAVLFLLGLACVGYLLTLVPP